MRSFTNKIRRLLINDEKYLAVISYTGNKIKNNIDKQREGEFSSAASQPKVRAGPNVIPGAGYSPPITECMSLPAMYNPRMG